MFLGTANPYYGTQLWLMHSDADQQPEKAPEVPDAKDLPESYVVRCTTDNSGHAAVSMSRIAGTAVIGEVAKSDDGYTCPVTVSTEAYAAAYAAQTGKAHTAAAGSITFNMTWDGEKWTAPTETDLPVIDVVCTADSGGSHRENSALKSSRRYLSGSFFVRTHTFPRVVPAPAKAALTG